jgi:hypothetical protein
VKRPHKTEGYESDPKEGNVVLLAERRMPSFQNRRIIQPQRL